MSTDEIKQQLLQYIEAGDDELVKLMYIVAREYHNDGKNQELDDTEIRILEERWENYKNGENKGYSWDEVKEAISKRKKPEIGI